MPLIRASGRKPRARYDRAVLDSKVFKAYDVRGIYPDELDEDGAYAIGRAYAELFSPQRLAVGRDMRISAPSMSQAVMAAWPRAAPSTHQGWSAR